MARSLVDLKDLCIAHEFFDRVLPRKGDPTNQYGVSVLCFGMTGNTGINAAGGLAGPGRLRQAGVNVTNGFTALP